MVNEDLTPVLNARSAVVTVNGVTAGTLTMVATDEFSFVYDPSYRLSRAEPISQLLPLREAPYICDRVHPFFDNLLFEGAQLRLAEKAYGLSRHATIDRFKLLLLTGSSTMSAISVLPIVDGKPVHTELAGETPTSEMLRLKLVPAYEGYCPACLEPNYERAHRSCLQGLWGTQAEIQLETFAEEPANIFNTIVPGQTFSGAQRKSVFCLSAGRVLRRTHRPTHILKPEGDFAEMPANEHVTMAIARALKFSVPPCGLFAVEGIGLVFAIKRFDIDPKRGIALAEDMAQLSGEWAEDKENASVQTLARVIHQFTDSPAIECAQLFRRLLFAFVSGNGDMHLKNWSILREPSSGLRKLAPLYDQMNVRASFPQEQVESILPINGKRNDLVTADFIQAATEMGLQSDYAAAQVRQVRDWLPIFNEFCTRSRLSPKMKSRYMNIVIQRAARLDP